ncbi:hypothetical protein [Pseudoalteromonas luteoviolacea]|uniref:Nmad2 family putative nucleotide modification protein n=1 Tax=Pseudoalteromonas luteoviolacea TaxID=43657 RepID=UPI0032B544D1
MFSYVVANDYGFAPNPYGGVLTLATCKPVIRRTARVGDIIVGLGSKRTVGNDKLVYAGIISEIVTMKEYGESERFAKKRPENMKSGDCIYYWDESGVKQRANPVHGKNDIERDTGGKNVLICNKYWYFGNKAQQVSPEILNAIKIVRGHRRCRDSKTVANVLKFIESLSNESYVRPYHTITLSSDSCGRRKFKKSRCGAC